LKEAGKLTSMDPDTHSIESINDIRYGVMIARKAKFESTRVLNAKSAKEFENWMKR